MIVPTEIVRDAERLLAEGQDGRLVRKLQYEVREGREAGEVVVIPKAFIANRNSSFILQEIANGDQSSEDEGAGFSDE